MSKPSKEELEAAGQAIAEEFLARMRAVPPDQRRGHLNPDKFAAPVGLHDDGQPLPGYRPPHADEVDDD